MILGFFCQFLVFWSILEGGGGGKASVRQGAFIREGRLIET